MSDVMQEIYHELWVRQRVIVKNVTIPVPQPHLVRPEPGYGVNPEQALTGDFPDPLFTKMLQEQEFTVLKAGAMLPCGTDLLLVRSEYDRIERLLVDSELGRWSDGPGLLEPGANLDHKLSGPSGSEGKSVFLSYLLARRLSMGQPTVYRENDRRCFLFDQYTPGKQVNADALFRLPMEQQKRLWILTSDPPTDPRWSYSCGWFVVLADIPEDMKSTSHSQWETGRNVGMHYMSDWQWSEIFAVFKLLGPDTATPSEIGNLYTTFVCLGPAARTCLISIPTSIDEGYNRRLSAHLRSVDTDIQTFLARGAYKSILASLARPLSPNSAVMEPAEHALFCTAGITTRWLAHRVLMVALEQSSRIGFGLFPYFLRYQGLQNISGWIFEGCAQYVLSHGGSFNASEIPIANNNSLPLKFAIQKNQSTCPHYFASAGHLAQQVQDRYRGGLAPDTVGKYFLPYSRRPESIDGLVFSHPDTLIIFRITIAGTLTIDFQEILDLSRALPATIRRIRVVFVVPQAHTRPDVTLICNSEAPAIIPPVSGSAIGLFQLVCTYGDMQAAVVHRPFI
ncbi:unnamed protein product [Tuber aestivum]|uniref:Uncharacterized protein n=1 Tax=Tuber aestivum TaxID=59557 RepID=A0A292PYG5_9PEZI|nr:unnamed protein product [Tuber aestivum]